MEHFNNLTLAEAERLAILIEECGEVIQAATKILRHGYASHHPTSKEDNTDNLERELGDLDCAVELMIKSGDVARSSISLHGMNKRGRILAYAHHQEERPW